MNIRKKVIALALLACCFWGQTHAQITLSGQLHSALPMGNWRTNYKMGFGAGAKFGYNFTDLFALKIALDYMQYRSQETSLIYKSKMPLQILGEFNFKVGKFTPFVGIGGGTIFQRDVPIGFRRKFTDWGATGVGGTTFTLSDRTFLMLQGRFFWDRDSPTQTISLGFGAKL